MKAPFMMGGEMTFITIRKWSHKEQPTPEREEVWAELWRSSPRTRVGGMLAKHQFDRGEPVLSPASRSLKKFSSGIIWALKSFTIKRVKLQRGGWAGSNSRFKHKWLKRTIIGDCLKPELKVQQQLSPFDKLSLGHWRNDRGSKAKTRACEK